MIVILHHININENINIVIRNRSLSYLVKKRSNLQLRALIILHGNSQSILNRGVIFFIVTALYTLPVDLKKKSQ